MKFQRVILYLAICLSLILHLGIYLGAQFLPIPTRILPTLPVEIIYNEKDSKLGKQIVTDPELGQIERQVKTQARLLSKFTRRVKKEMVARRTGASKNRPPGTSLTTDRPQANKQKRKAKSQIPRSYELKDLAARRQFLVPPSLPQDLNHNPMKRNLAFGGSTSGEYIPFVEEGNFTSLNTDQFLYYTFFSRVNEQIRYRWVGAIREFSRQLRQKDIRRLSRVQRKTKIEVLLQPDGYLKKILINQTSGEKGLDKAAVTAFQKAAPLLNPPLEMKQEDGFIHLYYSFVIQWQPGFFVKTAK